MFDTLSDKFQDIFRKLRGKAHLSESNIQEATREIRLALLEADPPKMSEESLMPEAKLVTLIDDFLDPKTDVEDDPEDIPAEYIDFLSVGLDVSSSDSLEKHDKNKADEQEK